MKTNYQRECFFQGLKNRTFAGKVAVFPFSKTTKEPLVASKLSAYTSNPLDETPDDGVEEFEDDVEPEQEEGNVSFSKGEGENGNSFRSDRSCPVPPANFIRCFRCGGLGLWEIQCATTENNDPRFD